MNFDDIKDKLVDSKDKVGDGLDKAGDFVKSKFGHDNEVDKGVQAGKDYLDREAAQEQSTTPTVIPEDPTAR